MDKIIKDLCVAVNQYEDKDGVVKNRYKKIGVEITERKESGEEYSYILLDRDVALSGFPNFSEKKVSNTVFVSKFEPKEKNTAESDGDVEGESFADGIY